MGSVFSFLCRVDDGCCIRDLLEWLQHKLGHLASFALALKRPDQALKPLTLAPFERKALAKLKIPPEQQ